MQVDITVEERQALLGWKKRSDSLILIRLKAEAILYASHGVDLDFIAEMVGRTVRTVKEWLSAWRASRLHSVITGHVGNENAAKLAQEQKEQLKEALSKPPSESGISADFWDVPALVNVVKTKIRCRVQVGLLLPTAHALLGHDLQAARPVRQAA